MQVRKIMTEQEKEKKSQRSKIIIGIILAGIMLFSTAGYFVMDFMGSGGSSGKKNIEYNSVKFSQNAYGYWEFTIQGYSFQTQYNPYDTVNVSVNTQKTLNDFSGKSLYYSAEPTEDSISQAGISEIGRNIGQFVQRANPACLSSNCSFNYPVKTCLNDTIVIFRESSSNLSKITDRDNCVVIEYSQSEDTIAADAFLFRIFGIK